MTECVKIQSNQSDTVNIESITVRNTQVYSLIDNQLLFMLYLHFSFFDILQAHIHSFSATVKVYSLTSSKADTEDNFKKLNTMPWVQEDLRSQIISCVTL